MQHSMVSLSLLLLAGLVSEGCSTTSYADPFADIKPYDRSAYERELTDCDTLAAHPSDPERVTDGVEEDDFDKQAAIDACLIAVSNDPDNPRLNYQLYRAYSYAGSHAEAGPSRAKALNASYPQALFVVGYIRIEGWDGREPDSCYGGELVRRSAQAGRLAGQLGFAHYAQVGKFEKCATYPTIDQNEIIGFLNEAESKVDDYYQRLLVGSLKAHFSAE